MKEFRTQTYMAWVLFLYHRSYIKDSSRKIGFMFIIKSKDESYCDNLVCFFERFVIKLKKGIIEDYMGRRKEPNKILLYTFFPVLLGVVLGTVIYLTCIDCIKGSYAGQGLEDYKIGAVMDLPLWKLSLYILKRRGCQIILFVLLTILVSYPITSFLYNFLFGLSYGMITSSLLIQFGFNGILYSFFCFFPHYLLYGFGIFLAGKWFLIGAQKKNMCYGNGNTLQYLTKVFMIFLLIFFAFFWEIKYQKNFLIKIFQHIV